MTGHILHGTWQLSMIIGYTVAAMTTTRLTTPFGPDVRSTVTSLYIKYARSSIECGLMCMGEPLCHGANYVISTGKCAILPTFTLPTGREHSTGTRYLDRDCLDEEDGVTYQGLRSTTVSGKTCQAWTSQSPHAHSHTDAAKYPDPDVPAGYCRNPNGEPIPWCYTTDPATRWEICDLSCCGDCPSKYDCPSPYNCSACKVTRLGYEYRGVLSVTSSRILCQRWDSQQPHGHMYGHEIIYPEATIKEAHNYCRNPDGSSDGPWCLTMDPGVRWEYCSVPDC